MKKVNEIAMEYNITVRTLHYYDEVGLVVPSRHNGIRYYEKEDEVKLGKVLLLKELGLPLSDIKQYISTSISMELLVSKRDEVIKKRNHLNEVIAMIDTYSLSKDEPRTKSDIMNPFGSQVRSLIGDANLNNLLETTDIDTQLYMERITKITRDIKQHIHDSESLTLDVDEYFKYMVEIVGPHFTKPDFYDVIVQNIEHFKNLNKEEQDIFLDCVRIFVDY